MTGPARSRFRPGGCRVTRGNIEWFARMEMILVWFWPPAHHTSINIAK
jgi:hypothetical protein